MLLLVPGVFLSMGDAEALLQRLSLEGALPGGLVQLHRRLGTPVRLIDTTAAGTVFVILLAGGRVEWLARAFAVTIAAYLLIKIAALLRLRGGQADAPYRVPLNIRVGRREVPLGLVATGTVPAGAGGARHRRCTGVCRRGAAGPARPRSLTTGRTVEPRRRRAAARLDPERRPGVAAAARHRAGCVPFRSNRTRWIMWPPR